MELLAGIIAFVVSVIAGLFPVQTVAYKVLPIPVVEQKVVRIFFVGDMMFDRSIRLSMEEKGSDHVFSCIADVLREADLVVGNLEGPITSTSSVSMGSTISSPKNFTFTFSPSVAPLLYAHNIRLVNIGNNHILNFGRWGLIETKHYLDEAGVGYFGTISGESLMYQTTINGVPLSFINYNEFSAEGDDVIYQVNETIMNEAKSGRVVVYTHWGEEYLPATPRMKRLAHDFIDAGADIVVGSH